MHLQSLTARARPKTTPKGLYSLFLLIGLRYRLGEKSSSLQPSKADRRLLENYLSFGKAPRNPPEEKKKKKKRRRKHLSNPNVETEARRTSGTAPTLHGCRTE